MTPTQTGAKVSYPSLSLSLFTACIPNLPLCIPNAPLPSRQAATVSCLFGRYMRVRGSGSIFETLQRGNVRLEARRAFAFAHRQKGL